MIQYNIRKSLHTFVHTLLSFLSWLYLVYMGLSVGTKEGACVNEREAAEGEVRLRGTIDWSQRRASNVRWGKF